MAQYGLNIKELNRIVQMNFSGIAAGVVYEGERHFDLVVRLDDEKTPRTSMILKKLICGASKRE